MPLAKICIQDLTWIQEYKHSPYLICYLFIFLMVHIFYIDCCCNNCIQLHRKQHLFTLLKSKCLCCKTLTNNMHFKCQCVTLVSKLNLSVDLWIPYTYMHIYHKQISRECEKIELANFEQIESSKSRYWEQLWPMILGVKNFGVTGPLLLSTFLCSVVGTLLW